MAVMWAKKGDEPRRKLRLFLIGNFAISYQKKRSAVDAHSRDWKMSQATALGARVS